MLMLDTNNVQTPVLGRKPQVQVPIKEVGARDSGRKPVNFTLSPVSRARACFCDLILGLAPQALYCRPLRGLCLRLLRRLSDFLCKAAQHCSFSASCL